MRVLPHIATLYSFRGGSSQTGRQAVSKTLKRPKASLQRLPRTERRAYETPYSIEDPVHQLCRAPADTRVNEQAPPWRRRHVPRAECMLLLAVVGQKRRPNTTVHYHGAGVVRSLPAARLLICNRYERRSATR